MTRFGGVTRFCGTPARLLPEAVGTGRGAGGGAGYERGAAGCGRRSGCGSGEDGSNLIPIWCAELTWGTSAPL